MTEQVRGCHHCIGTGVTVTDLVFKFLESHANSKEQITASDVSELRRRFLDGFAHGYEFFETIHRKCMDASRSPGAKRLSRDNILPALLAYCSGGAAAAAFKLEVASCGSGWIDDFFVGFARYIAVHVHSDAQGQLVKVFVNCAGKHKSNLNVEKLLLETKAQQVLYRCIEPFGDPNACQAMADPISLAVNEHIARQRHIIGAHLAKTTADDIRLFLEKLPTAVKASIQACLMPEPDQL